jgi:hypothetical protein
MWRSGGKASVNSNEDSDAGCFNSHLLTILVTRQVTATTRLHASISE